MAIWNPTRGQGPDDGQNGETKMRIEGYVFEPQDKFVSQCIPSNLPPQNRSNEKHSRPYKHNRRPTAHFPTPNDHDRRPTDLCHCLIAKEHIATKILLWFPNSFVTFGNQG
jgi:hypothetical protein